MQIKPGDTKIRSLEQSDADRFLRLLKQLDGETEFMAFEPGERKTSVEEQEKKISEFSSAIHFVRVAENNGHFIGYIGATRGNTLRTKHSAKLAIGVLQEYKGAGAGSSLMKALELWAKENEVSRLELHVLVNNKAAIGLYNKFKFEIEGIRRSSVKIGSKLVDEYLMAKIL